MNSRSYLPVTLTGKILQGFCGVFLLVSISGCVPSSQPEKQGPPAWILDPKTGLDPQKNVAVGCANTHYKGQDAQKKLAIKRAIEQIAIAKKSNVSTVSKYTKSMSTNGVSSSKTDSKSIHSSDVKNISTKVLDTYTYDSGRICVRVIEQ